MANGDLIKCIVTIKTVKYYKDSTHWGVVVAQVDEIIEGKPIEDKTNRITIRGIMPLPIKGNQYIVSAEERYDRKWGKQYEAVCMSTNVYIAKNDYASQRKFLEKLFTPNQVESMYKCLSNPYETFMNGRAEDLIVVKGCGMYTAVKWMDKFQKAIPLSRMYVELESYNLTPAMMQKLLNKYKSVDLAINNVKENPYGLMEMTGIGWKSADKIAIDGGLDSFALSRVKSFIEHYLATQALNGYSYITSQSLMDAIVETIGEDVPDLVVSEAVHSIDDLWYSPDKEYIGLEKYHRLEMRIAKELIRLRDAKSKIKKSNWEEIIREKEKEQGWKYTEQQFDGIKKVMENNVVFITGYAGTGKSSIVNGMLSVLNDYSFAMTALSGRAAARMKEITNEEGSTIHRLLKYPDKSKESKQGFFYHDDNLLQYDIIIVDEISMIGGYLFYNLIRAIKSGAKLILLGDVGQLEALGECNIAYDILNSDEIVTVCLDKIHRQAASSALITESIKIRNGEQIIPKDYVGVEVRGELKDLTIDCYSDKSNTFYKVVQHFAEEIEHVESILDLQVLVPVKTNGDACTWKLNCAIQEIYNPKEKGKQEIEVFYAQGMQGTIRIGDKVINTKNNYNTRAYDKDYEMTEEDYVNFDSEYLPTGEITPIFNGNIGIVTKVDPTLMSIVVDFVGIGEVYIPKDALSGIELGYAITVHKSQGSQFQRIIVGIDFASYSLLNRQMLYTALTRGREHGILVAQNSALRYATAQTSVSSKLTHLQNCLYEVAHPKYSF